MRIPFTVLGRCSRLTTIYFETLVDLGMYIIPPFSN